MGCRPPAQERSRSSRGSNRGSACSCWRHSSPVARGRRNDSPGPAWHGFSPSEPILRPKTTKTEGFSRVFGRFHLFFMPFSAPFRHSGSNLRCPTGPPAALGSSCPSSGTPAHSSSRFLTWFSMVLGPLTTFLSRPPRNLHRPGRRIFHLSHLFTRHTHDEPRQAPRSPVG